MIASNGRAREIQTIVLLFFLGGVVLLNEAPGGSAAISLCPAGARPGHLVLLFDQQKTHSIMSSRAGYLLAIDRSGVSVCGLAGLAKSDLNRDGRIDRKDPTFRKLVLWRDENEDGKVQAGELHSLASKRVVSLSLRFHFVFRDTSGRTQNGELLSIFEKEPVPKPPRDLASGSPVEPARKAPPDTASAVPVWPSLMLMNGDVP